MTDRNAIPTTDSNLELEIEKLADLCAVGAMPIPDDLPDQQQRELFVAIAARRRKRLIHFFASAIAEDIWRDRQTKGNPKC